MLTCFYSGQKIYIGDFIDKLPLRQLGRDGSLLCSDSNCRRPVLLHQGKFKRPYFAHRKGDGKDCRFGGAESEEHEAGKRYIFDLLRLIYGSEKVLLEETLENRQKADVLLNLGSQRFAYEIQFSEQDGNTWETRNEKYRDIDVVPVWILGYRKHIHEIVVPQGNRRPAKIKLGSTREYAVTNASIVQELVANLSRRTLRKNESWDMDERYKAVHILSISEGILELCLGYVTQKSATIWEGYLLPITQNSLFDQSQGRFIPDAEVNARRIAEEKLQARIEWKNRLNSIQEELRIKVLAYTKAKRTTWLPVVLANEDIFYGEEYEDGDYDILLLEVALYLKIIRLKSFSEETIEEYFRNWKFDWREYRYLLMNGEIGSFFKRLEKVGVLTHKNGVWEIKDTLSDQPPVIGW